VSESIAADLESARQRLRDLGLFDESAWMPALSRYTGVFYDNCAPALDRFLDAGGHVVILSGGYGAVLGYEQIGNYDRRFTPGDWPRKLIGRALGSYCERHDLDEVVAFLARSTSYADVIRTAPWPESVGRVALVSADHYGGGAMRVVPEALGEAAAAFVSAGIPGGWTSRRGTALAVELIVDASREVDGLVNQLTSGRRYRPRQAEADCSIRAAIWSPYQA